MKPDLINKMPKIGRYAAWQIAMLASATLGANMVTITDQARAQRNPSGGAGLAPAGGSEQARKPSTGGVGLPGPLRRAEAAYAWGVEHKKNSQWTRNIEVVPRHGPIVYNPADLKVGKREIFCRLIMGKAANNPFGALVKVEPIPEPYGVLLDTNPQARAEVTYSRLMEFDGTAGTYVHGNFYSVGVSQDQLPKVPPPNMQ